MIKKNTEALKLRIKDQVWLFDLFQTVKTKEFMKDVEIFVKNRFKNE